MKGRILIYLAVFFLSGIAIGLWFGQRTSSHHVGTGCRPASHGELDLFYTDVLKVSERQEREILEIERRYQEDRNRFTERMDRANLQLAEVIDHDGYESDKIRPLVNEIHTAMGELQTLSLSHLAAVEKVLDAEQAALLKSSAVTRLKQH